MNSFKKAILLSVSTALLILSQEANAVLVKEATFLDDDPKYIAKFKLLISEKDHLTEERREEVEPYDDDGMLTTAMACRYLNEWATLQQTVGGVMDIANQPIHRWDLFGPLFKKTVPMILEHAPRYSSFNGSLGRVQLNVLAQHNEILQTTSVDKPLTYGWLFANIDGWISHNHDRFAFDTPDSYNSIRDTESAKLDAVGLVKAGGKYPTSYGFDYTTFLEAVKEFVAVKVPPVTMVDHVDYLKSDPKYISWYTLETTKNNQKESVKVGDDDGMLGLAVYSRILAHLINPTSAPVSEEMKSKPIPHWDVFGHMFGHAFTRLIDIVGANNGYGDAYYNMRDIKNMLQEVSTASTPLTYKWIFDTVNPWIRKHRDCFRFNTTTAGKFVNLGDLDLIPNEKGTFKRIYNFDISKLLTTMEKQIASNQLTLFMDEFKFLPNNKAISSFKFDLTQKKKGVVSLQDDDGFLTFCAVTKMLTQFIENPMTVKSEEDIKAQRIHRWDVFGPLLAKSVDWMVRKMELDQGQLESLHAIQKALKTGDTTPLTYGWLYDTVDLWIQANYENVSYFNGSLELKLLDLGLVKNKSGGYGNRHSFDIAQFVQELEKK
ncbi:MAG TPA: hypothetical protein VNJ29_03245 [Candidatus Nitrosotenuis sp.]|jgi:hypothetical protein|nr:hypothetical protein [Candidatus Nitrosotenuis sp.]